MEEKTKKIELYKVSKETFNQKKANLNKRYKEIKTQINHEKLSKIKQAKSKLEINKIKQQFKNDLNKARYKYTLLTNAFHSQELYRRGILESKIEKAKKEFKKRKKTILSFDKVKEKEKLKEKIKKLYQDYSRPISTHYRKNRVAELVNKTDIKNLKVPLKSPTLKYLKIIIVIILASVITTLALDLFYKPFGLYNAGLRGITQIIYYIILEADPLAPMWYSHGIFLIFNIPLVIWGWFKVGKKFTIYTSAFIIVQYLTSLILSETSIYHILKPFGFSPFEIIEQRQSANGLSDLYQYAIIFLSAILAAIFYGIGVGLIYKIGGSTGGSKIIMTFIAAKTNKSVGYFSSLFGIFVIILGISVNRIAFEHLDFIEAFVSPILLASLVFVFISNYFLNLVFNKAKKIRFSLITTKMEEIQYFLDYYLMYDHSYSFNKIKKGHWSKEAYRFEFIIHPNEANHLRQYFLRIDPHALILQSEIQKISGRFFNSWFE